MLFAGVTMTILTSIRSSACLLKSKLRHGAFHIVMLESWKDATRANDASANWGKWKMGWGPGTKIAQIRDGSSQTLMMGEVLGYMGYNSPEVASQKRSRRRRHGHRGRNV